MALSIVILVGFGFYLVTKSQRLEIQIKKLERHVSDVEYRLRRVRVKIVTHLTGILEEGKGSVLGLFREGKNEKA